LFFAATKVFCWLAKLLLRYRVCGPPNWAAGRPLIISANHQSYLDFPLIAGSMPYPVFCRLFTLSTTRLTRGSLHSWFGRTVRAIPIDPDRNARTALRLAMEGLRRGMVMCVFPEGHRSVDAGLQPFRMGAAMVAVESAAETIPAGIAGTGEVWGRGSKRIKLAPVRLQFGAGISAASGEDYHSFNRRLLGAVEGLVRGH
jgi:1-acyl-sn-glycerol-3-phosphate acyltransferase